MLIDMGKNACYENRNVPTLISRCKLADDYTMEKSNKIAILCSTNSAADNCATALRRSGIEGSQEKGVFLRIGTRPENKDIRENCWVGTLKKWKKNGDKF